MAGISRLFSLGLYVCFLFSHGINGFMLYLQIKLHQDLFIHGKVTGHDQLSVNLLVMM